MKKALLFLFLPALLASFQLHAQFVITNLNLPVQHPGVAVVDIDGDGDLDILITGENGASQNSQLYKNNGSGVFTAVASPFTTTTRTTFSWNDINQDGKLDVLMAGFPVVGAPIDSVYTSNGTGTFTRAATIALPQTAPSAGFADLNNDGYPDIYVFGNDNFGHPKIFFNNKAGGFTESDQFNSYSFIDPVVTVIDYDNDKDLDLFVTAGYNDSTNTRFSKMFVNNNGVFTVKDLGLIEKGNGSATWGDYNGDGYPDLLLNGDGGFTTGEDANDIYRLYKNVAGTFTAVTTFSSYRQNHTGNGGRLVDWDNDGDLDVIVSGYSFTQARQATDIYLNNNGVFTAYSGNTTIPGVSENSIETADVDGDGDLDIVESGYSNNNYKGAGSAFNSNVSLIITNPTLTKNTPPTKPTNLQVTGNQAALNFSWTAATDATTPQNALSYNMYLTDATGKWFYDPLADTSTGKLALQKMGNVDLNKGWILKNLPAGSYCAGVQAIDNSFAGSPFARLCFTVNANGTLPVTLASFTVAADGNRANITWATTTEQNSAYFVVEHATDGVRFSSLTTVTAKGGSGVNNYSVYDASPAKGQNYYRLTLYNKDGTSTAFDIKTISFSTGGNTVAIVYPNPVVKDMGIKLTNYTGSKVAVTITDLSGKTIYNGNLMAHSGQEYYPLSLPTKLAGGTYILKLTGDNLNTSLRVLVN